MMKCECRYYPFARETNDDSIDAIYDAHADHIYFNTDLIHPHVSMWIRKYYPDREVPGLTISNSLFIEMDDLLPVIKEYQEGLHYALEKARDEIRENIPEIFKAEECVNGPTCKSKKAEHVCCDSYAYVNGKTMRTGRCTQCGHVLDKKQNEKYNKKAKNAVEKSNA